MDEKKNKFLNIEMAGCIEYNGINCRNRTAFRDELNRVIYLEFDAGHFNIKTNKPGNVYFHITHLFRLDIEKDRRANHSIEFDAIIHEINKRRLPYTQETINTVLWTLGLPDTVETVVYCDGYDGGANYRVHDGIDGFNIGN